MRLWSPSRLGGWGVRWGWGAACLAWPVSGWMQDRATGAEQPLATLAARLRWSVPCSEVGAGLSPCCRLEAGPALSGWAHASCAPLPRVSLSILG